MASSSSTVSRPLPLRVYVPRLPVLYPRNRTLDAVLDPPVCVRLAVPVNPTYWVGGAREPLGRFSVPPSTVRVPLKVFEPLSVMIPAPILVRLPLPLRPPER